MRLSKKKKIMGILLIAILLLLLFGSGGQEDIQVDTQVNTSSTEDNEWVIYWYLCGSDLESDYGMATTDLQELIAVKLPKNVKVVIQTGGAKQWINEQISPDHVERYVYDNNGLHLIEQIPQANMGSEKTLSDFLAFAKSNYPAKKTGIIIWNHGGGSIAGAAFDEIYNNDSLTLDEMYNAFAANYELSVENPPFELIGFDACLMATLDVAYTFSDIGKYLVASQELEPGNGWYYTGWLNALVKNPEMDGLALGKIICDTYKQGCEMVGTAGDITLSVINLAKIPDLMIVYNDFGREALANVIEDKGFYSRFARIAVATENYGGNTREQGFTNMVDLGHLARQSSKLLSKTSNILLSFLEDCVEYKISGPYRKESTGLSSYYSYNGDINDFNNYVKLGAGEAFKHFYAYGLTGKLSEDGKKYLAQISPKSLPKLETLESQGWEDHPLEVDSEGVAILTLGEKAKDILSGIYFHLYYVDYEEDIMYHLGSDNEIISDWENGIFKDNFRGVWGAIDGRLAYMELSQEGEDYNIYAVPILLNDEYYILSVVYDFEKEAYEIQGARKGIDESGMADKNLRQLVEGDVITTIHYYFETVDGDDDELIPFEAEQIIVTSETSFGEVELGDGIFLQMFEMRDIQGYTAYSEVIKFEIEDGVILTSVGF